MTQKLEYTGTQLFSLVRLAQTLNAKNNGGSAMMSLAIVITEYARIKL